MPWPQCADCKGARGTGPQPAGKGRQGQAAPGRGSGREQNGLSQSGGKARRGAGGHWALPSASRVQAEPGTARLPQPAPAQPCPGAKQAQSRGCAGVPARTAVLSHGHKGRRCPAPRSPVHGVPDRAAGSRGGGAGNGQAGSSSRGLAIIAVEGHGWRQTGSRWVAGSQDAVGRAGDAGKCQGTGRVCHGAEPPLASPA